MTGLEALIDQPMIQAVGWALLHFVWQGALVGALAAVALRLLRRSAADVRYVVAAVALSLMATLPLVTGVQVFRAARAEVVNATSPAAGTPLVTTGGASLTEGYRAAGPLTPVQESAPAPVIAAVEQWLPLFVLAWMAGVGILAVRLVGGWLWLQRMKTLGAVAADVALQTLVRRLSRSLHIGRPITLLRSPGVDVPTVIGWLKPTVLLPMSALSGMSPLQIEAILAHELAHVRRHDYLVNLLQTLLETLLFYHPAVWWLSRQIRTERENCCDDLAVSLCGDPVVYARALADLEELRGPAARLVLAASGGALLERVRRLLTGPATHAGRGPAWLAATAAVLLMFVIVGGAVGRKSLSASATTPALQALPAPEPVAAAPAVDPEQALDIANTSAEDRHTPEPSGQAGPRPPTPPTPPAPPAAPDRSSTAVSGDEQRSSGTFTWASDGEKIEVKYTGAFEINDDDTGIAKLSPGSSVRISDGAWFTGRSVEFTADASGAITTRYRVGNQERAFEPEGRQWLATIMPKLVRRSGFAAKARVARFLQKGGVPAVLAEISQIDSSYAKKVYFTELLTQATLDAGAARRMLEQAGREVESDYELATILIAGADKLLLDDGTRKAYFDATRSIDSDYEMRRVLTAALKRGEMTPALMTELLGAARGLDSDYEAASLLLDVVKQQGVEGPLRAPFFMVVGGLGSAYERGRVLKALLRRSDVSPATLLDILTAADAMGGDYEISQVLQTAARSHAITGPARAAYLEAADRLGDYEQTQALSALVRNERR